jgi:hypothetical protein
MHPFLLSRAVDDLQLGAVILERLAYCETRKKIG